MVSPPTQATRPSYVPPGYGLRWQIDGEIAPGFHQDPTQTVGVYTRSWNPDDRTNPLMVCAASGIVTDLMGTEGHTGQAIDLGIPGITAVYHDGMWAPGVGREQWTMGNAPFHWDTTSAHSITARWQNRVIAIRAAKNRDVGIAMLVKIARSMFGVV